MQNNNWTDEKIKKWIDSQTWYQKIQLSNGLQTPGTIDSKTRLKLLKGVDVSGKSVIDIGCNSGYYCLWSKNQGATHVVGVDINEQRIQQAKTIAEIERAPIEYHLMPISEVEKLGQFDVVFCFAVLTEIPDILGSLKALASVIRHEAYIELAAAPAFLLIL